MELLKLISTNELIAQLVSFLMLFFLLRKFAWDKILNFIDQRRETIANELARIEEEKQNALKAQAEYEARIKNIEVEAKKIFQAAAEEGARITEELRQKARDEAHGIVENARKAMQFDLNKIRGALKEELVDITIRAAELLIEEKLTEQQDRRIVENFLQEIEKM
jgi:F-type H+-transporting ATPase subunit b